MSRLRGTPERGQSDWEQFGDEVGRKEARKIKGRRDKKRSPLFWVGMWGLVGWAVAMPTAAGIWVGVTLDEAYPGPPSWTLTGVIVGLALGCLTAWFWVKREITRED